MKVPSDQLAVRLFLVFSIGLPLICVSQNIRSEVSIYIPATITVSTGGNINNKGFLQNNGTISLKGDWTNTAVYQGNGMISLEGLNQVMVNNDQPVEILSIDGGGSKTLKGKITVKRELDLNDGIVFVSAGDTLLADINCTVNGGSITGFINGAFTTRGTGYKFYPVGKRGKYHPLELLEVTGIDPTIAVEVQESLPSRKTIPGTLLYQDVYWQRTTVSGTFENSPITLAYSMPSGTDPIRYVIAESASLSDDFKVIQNTTFKDNADLDIIGTRVPVTKDIFALGELLIDPPRQQYLSTTLSPNAQNPVNRVIKFFGDNPNPSAFSFQVFNRWGLVIFETQSFTQMNTDGWDGKQNGTMLPSGVYPYSARFTDISGNTVHSTGFITLVN